MQRSHAGDDQGLAAERDDATCQERPEKQSQVAPLGKEMYECIEHSSAEKNDLLEKQLGKNDEIIAPVGPFVATRALVVGVA